MPAASFLWLWRYTNKFLVEDYLQKWPHFLPFPVSMFLQYGFAATSTKRWNWFSWSLDLGWSCDLLWPIEHGRSNWSQWASCTSPPTPRTHEQAWASLLENKKNVEKSPVVLAKGITDQPTACWLEMHDWVWPRWAQRDQKIHPADICKPMSNKSTCCFQHCIWEQLITQQ